MHQPAHLDGCSVVILRKVRRAFSVQEQGRLSHDGQKLMLVHGDARRLFTDAEIGALLSVTTDSRIPECKGFDFFLIAE